MTTQDTLAPHNLEAEEATIGALLIDQDAILDLIEILEPGHFYLSKHRLIYQTILELFNRRKPVDMVTLTDELERQGQLDNIGGPAALTDLSLATPTSMHAKYYAGLVKDTAIKRELIEAAAKATETTYNWQGETVDLVTEVQGEFLEISGTIQRATDLRHISFGLGDMMDTTEKQQADPKALVGLPTGLKDIDRLLGGLRPADMVTLAARPGMGKTSFALNIALQAAQRYRKRIAIFSLEMSAEQLSRRLVSLVGGIASDKWNRGNFNETDYTNIARAAGVLGELPLYIDDTPALSPQDLRAKCRKQAAWHGLDLVIVDYIQLMAGQGQNREQEVAFCARQIKTLAMELNVPVLALGQLNRSCENRADKRPMLSDLRESGGIEQDSDVVMFLYRDELYNPDTKTPHVAECIIAKHRSGPTGICSLYFQKEVMKFADLTIRTEVL